jgi:peptidoglycan/xylan/chitin deacetylase (PgdA/CDA1 family)
VSKQRERPVCHIHIDCDDSWTYEQDYELVDVGTTPSIYDEALPWFLEQLRARNLKATFFVVGRDLERENARRFIAAAARDGHWIANHSYTHADLSRLTRAGKEEEIVRGHEAIAELAGTPPRGFRAPKYYLDDDIAGILLRLGYRYDSSILPGPAALLMRSYFLLSPTLSLKNTFGRGDYFTETRNVGRLAGEGATSLYEVPIATMPFFRLPIHTTFVYKFGTRYLDIALNLLKRIPGPHVYLFHAVDFAGTDGAGSHIKALPANAWKAGDRRVLIGSILDRFADAFTVQALEETLTAGALIRGQSRRRPPINAS